VNLARQFVFMHEMRSGGDFQIKVGWPIGPIDARLMRDIGSKQFQLHAKVALKHLLDTQRGGT